MFIYYTLYNIYINNVYIQHIIQYTMYIVNEMCIIHPEIHIDILTAFIEFKVSSDEGRCEIDINRVIER